MTTWSRQPDALTPVSGTMISTSNIVERPKGLSKYVLLMSELLNRSTKRSDLQQSSEFP